LNKTLEGIIFIAKSFFVQLNQNCKYMKQIRNLLERSAFGVCHYIGEKMNISSSRVRLYFLYISCITLGSPFIVYLFVAFWLNIREYIRNGSKVLWQ
jgi:phage shock protein PspC (stress-responsive transcriptional regulator)